MASVMVGEGVGMAINSEAEGRAEPPDPPHADVRILLLTVRQAALIVAGAIERYLGITKERRPKDG